MEKIYDKLNEQALAHIAIRDPATFASFGIGPEDFQTTLYALAVTLALELPLDDFEPCERLTRVLERGRSSNRITDGQSADLFNDLLDPPPDVLPDPEKLRRHAYAYQLVNALRASQLTIMAGDVERGVLMAMNAVEAPSRSSNDRYLILDADGLAAAALDEAARFHEGNNVSLGVPALERAVGPAAPGDVLVVGADTNVGKSSFVLEMCLNAMDLGHGVGFLSIEDSAARTARRFFAALANVSPRRLKSLDGLKIIGQHIDDFTTRYRGKIAFCHGKGMTEVEVAGHMTRMSKLGARFIIVDYIQAVKASVRSQDRRNEMRLIMQHLKEHAVRIGVLLVVVSQLVRPKDGMLGREPTKYMLKEAGELENEAEYIVLLWRTDERDDAPVYARIAKGKDGGLGTQWVMRRQPGSARLVETDEEVPDRPRQR